MIMEARQKLGFVTTCLSLVILVLPFVGSHQEALKREGSHTNSSSDVLKQWSPKLLYEIRLHGFLLWASMGFLMPIGIVAMRMSNREECSRRLKTLFYIHGISQIVAVLLVTAGAVMSIKNFSNLFDNHHQRIGVALYGIIWLQAVLGCLRPQRGCKGRSAWFVAHWLLGTALTLLGIINTYTGFQAYHQKTSRSIKLWTILFTAQISFIALFYLFQDKWAYIQKQGVISGDELVTPTENDSSTRDKQKESI